MFLANGLIDRNHKVRLLIYKGEFSKNKFRLFVRKTWLKILYPNAVNCLGQFKGKVETFEEINRCDFQKDEIVIATGIWSCREINKLHNSEIRKIHNIRGQIPWEKDLMKQAWSEDVPKVAVASYLKETVREICNLEVSAVIPNGVDTSRYYPSVPESQRDGIGTIYHLSYHKDPEIVLSVLGKLQDVCCNVPQRVFGVSRRPGTLTRNSYARYPSVEKARDIYSRSMVWIMASRSEGFPNPVLEAMACGCAVVATDCGGSRDIITDGENGFLAEVGNTNEIVDKVKLLLNNPDLREKMVANARETVIKFSWKNSFDKWEEFLKRIVNNKRIEQSA